MTDLNLAATVTDGGSTTGLAFHDPSRINDGNILTDTYSDSGVANAETITRRLKSDLGSALAVEWMTVYAENHDGGDPAWTVEHSADAVTWTPVTGYGYVWTPNVSAEMGRSDITFDAATARYWRISSSDTYGGLSFFTDFHIWTWAIGEATPPPPPEPGVGVDFDEDDFDTDDELAGYVTKYRIQRGASAEITGGATIGTCWLELRNIDDRFNPLNAGGPFYGKLRDGKPMWIGINADGAISGTDPRGLFGGRTVDWTPIPVGGAEFAPTVELTGEDCLGWYDRTPVRVADAIGRSYGELRVAMLDDADESRTSLANEILTMPLSSWDGSLLDGLEAINKVNGTRHFCQPADDRALWYRYTTRNRQWRLDATVDATLDGAADALTTDGWRLSADTVVNQQKATVSPVSFAPSSTIVWEAQGLPYHVTSAADRVIWVEFDDYVDAPVASTNSTGTAPTVTLEPFGNTAKLTIHTSGTTTITRLLIAGALAKRGNSVSAIEDDTASQAGTRGIRAGSEISGDLMGVLANAQGIAAHVVWRYGNPQFRPTATVINWIPDQFDIDLFDIVSVTVAELQMTARLFEVVGLEHEGVWAEGGIVDGAPKHLHSSTYVLQECAVQSDPGWFVLDTSELDSADILAY